MILGDMGADVIKVERPGSGDESRGWGPPFAPDGQSAYFLSVNRNKLGVALDLDSVPDREVFRSLVAGADVVIENFRRRTLERRGIDASELLERHPRLVWCTLSGFGPESDRPGYDFVVQAESGWMSVTGPIDGEPTKVGIALADVMAGKDAAIAILGALAARSTQTSLSVTQRRLSISLFHSAAAALINVAQNTLVTGREAARWGNGHPNLVPYELFQAADRPFVLAVGNDGQWKAACGALELDALGDDPALSTNAGRIAHRSRVLAALSSRLAERNANEWLGRLTAAGVPCGVVKPVSEALKEVTASALTGVAPSVPGTVRLPPPYIDQHGDLIRRQGWAAFHS